MTYSPEKAAAAGALRALRSKVVTLQLYARGYKEDRHQRRAFQRVVDLIDRMLEEQTDDQTTTDA